MLVIILLSLSPLEHEQAHSIMYTHTHTYYNHNLYFDDAYPDWSAPWLSCIVVCVEYNDTIALLWCEILTALAVLITEILTFTARLMYGICVPLSIPSLMIKLQIEITV